MLSCIETKHTLSGRTKVYHCELVHYTAGFGILRYVIDSDYDIAGLKLAPGDETLAVYWEDRPYTLYIWRRKVGDTAYYFNIADQVSLSPRSFVWRDLAVDILIDERGVHVLDEHELPPDIDPDLRQYISDAVAHILDRQNLIIHEALDLASPYV